MIVCTTLFKAEGWDARFADLLAMWLGTVRANVSEAQPLILTDGTCAKELAAFKAPSLTFPSLDIHPERVSRTNASGYAFDRKGALVLHALTVLSGSILYLDTDALPQAGIYTALRNLPATSALLMPPDAGKMVHRVETGESTPARNAGILWFPWGFDRAELIATYQEAWAHVERACPGNTWVEQMTWALTWQRLGSCPMGREFNWVPHLYKEPSGPVFVRHSHGPKKWSLLE